MTQEEHDALVADRKRQEVEQKLQKAYAIVERVPEKDLELGTWCRESEGSCGTIACAAGWISSSKEFPGLILEPITPFFKGSDTGKPLFKEGKLEARCYEAMALALGISEDDAEELFGLRNRKRSYDEYWCADPDVSDKEFWLARMRNFMKWKEDERNENG